MCDEGACMFSFFDVSGFSYALSGCNFYPYAVYAYIGMCVVIAYVYMSKCLYVVYMSM